MGVGLLALYSSPLVCLSVFMAVQYYFDRCSFIATFEIKTRESLILFFFKDTVFL